MYYYNLNLASYEPLLDRKPNQDQEQSPRQIVNDASKFLQTLVRLYYLRHGFDAMDLFIVIPLVMANYEVDLQRSNNMTLSITEPLSPSSKTYGPILC